MFTKLIDIPAPIVGFYTETVVQVSTGNFYTQFYYDQGKRKSRQVEYFRQVLKVVEKPRGEAVTWAKVAELVGQGTPESVVDKFMEAALAHEGWQFHDEYLAWVKAQPAPEYDEDGNPLPVEPVGEEPVRVVTDPKEYRVTLAKKARDTGRYAPIESGGYVWDADPESYMNMTGTIASWEVLTDDATMVDIGLVKNGKMAWTMEDNSAVYVTKEELQRVVDAIRARAGLLHAQYSQIKA